MEGFINNNKSITVFAYAFPHKKTYDFLNIIKSHGFNNVTVIGAPKVKLKNITGGSLFHKLPVFSPRIDCDSLCKVLGFRFVESHHNDVDNIKNNLTAQELSGSVLIAGARIISEEIISLFDSGIVNFHPGKIPETSGLDSFYWMIQSGAQPGITVHEIDYRVDAGQEIFFHEIELSPDDSPSIVEYKIYNGQLLALNRYLSLVKACSDIRTTAIDRPFKNNPMSVVEKELCLSQFDKWLSSAVDVQHKIQDVIQACIDDNVGKLEEIISADIINYKLSNGWSPLSVSCFNHSYKCCEYLVKHGADINIVSDKGTTPLMYAKTKNIADPNLNFKLVTFLIENGADLYQKDYLNNDVFYYIKNSDNPALCEQLKAL